LPSGVVNLFTYNGDGQRVQKVDSVATTKHIWDGQNISVETDGTNVINAVYTIEPIAYGNLISERRAGTTLWYAYDVLGSTRHLTDVTGAMADTYLYDSWGNLLASTGSTMNPFRFAGRSGYYWDADIAAYYLRGRFLDPTRGRLYSRDVPYVLEGTDLYIYVSNRPTFSLDPSGWVPCSEMSWDNESCYKCPPCPCSDTLTGTETPGDGFPIGEQGQSVVAELGGSKCRISFKIADCGGPIKGISWTCAKGIERGKRRIFICISKDQNRCDLDAVVYHEAVHALDYCNQPSGQEAQITPEDCKKKEGAAYKVSCKKQSEEECVPTANKDKWIANCVKRGVEVISCNKDIRNVWQPCITDLPRVFPESSR
jgi:RHS repeat-associated protein